MLIFFFMCLVMDSINVLINNQCGTSTDKHVISSQYPTRSPHKVEKQQLKWNCQSQVNTLSFIHTFIETSLIAYATISSSFAYQNHTHIFYFSPLLYIRYSYARYKNFLFVLSTPSSTWFYLYWWRSSYESDISGNLCLSCKKMTFPQNWKRCIMYSKR